MLACVHEMGEAEATQIRQRLEPFRPLSHASVVTLLRRLEAKGIVTRRKADVGKAFVYSATRAPEETYRQVVGRMVERVFGGDPVALVTSLFGARAPSEAQLERLDALVEELHARQREDDS